MERIGTAPLHSILERKRLRENPGAVLSYLRNLNAESLHFPAKLVRVAVEDDARHTGALGTFDVLGCVVDKQTFLGDKLERFVQQTVNLCFRFDQLDIGRNERPVKILTAGYPRPVFVLAVAGVGQ